MMNPMADDLFEIYGTQIELSSIKNYRLRQIEFLLRPVYAERQYVGKSIFGKTSLTSKIEFAQMEYYAAVIDETRYNTKLKLKMYQIWDGFYAVAKLNGGRRSSATLTGMKQRHGVKDTQR